MRESPIIFWTALAQDASELGIGDKCLPSVSVQRPRVSIDASARYRSALCVGNNHVTLDNCDALSPRVSSDGMNEIIISETYWYNRMRLARNAHVWLISRAQLSRVASHSRYLNNIPHSHVSLLIFLLFQTTSKHISVDFPKPDWLVALIDVEHAVINFGSAYRTC